MEAGADAGEDLQVDLPGVQFVLQEDEEFLHGAGDPVGLVDDQGVPGLEGGECGVESGPGAAGAGGFDDHLAATGHGQGVDCRTPQRGLGTAEGGTTTLRHYADPVSEIDRRAAAYLAELTGVTITAAHPVQTE